MEENKTKERVYITGHKNPDTDSICSAIAYAQLKQQTGCPGREYIAYRAGRVNEETKYVLEHFGVEALQYIETVQPEICDVELNLVGGVESSDSIKRAWDLMDEQGSRSLPVLSDGILEGIISITDIAQSYMDESDSHVLANAKTSFASIAETLNGQILCGGENEFFDKGKVTIAASSPELMEEVIQESDLVIVGNRFESHFTAIELGAKCLVMCQGSNPTKTIKKLAVERGCIIISTPYDTFTAARLINQSIPVSFFMTHDNLLTFGMNSSLEDIEEIMKTNRFHNFPVIDEAGKYVGLISRRRLLNTRRKKVILVDHNETNQAVDGIEKADVLEIIDHHRLGGFETLGPVYFRNQPVGCTATIILQMYDEKGVVPDRQIAGLLAAAIISDTLMFRSPTCTALDRAACERLADIAGEDIRELASSMFKAGSNLQGKTPQEICYQDFKVFSNEGYSFGVGQISSMDQDELEDIKAKVRPVMKDIAVEKELDMMFLMMTDIAETSTELLCYGSSSENFARQAFDVPEDAEKIQLKNIVSRKKQFLPKFVEVLGEYPKE